MGYAPKIVLQLPLINPNALPAFVEACLRDGVKLIAVVGPACEDTHNRIDDLIVGEGADGGGFIMTTWHTDETVDEVVEFARDLETGANHRVQLVCL